MREHQIKDTIHVLVVEDSPGDTRLLEQVSLLSASDFFYLKSGEEALQYLRQEDPYTLGRRPDLIVLDLNSPRADFIPVVVKVKADPHLRIIPIIVFSRSNSDSEIREAYSDYVACVVKRPTIASEYLEVCQGIARFWLEFVCYPPRND